MAAALLSGLAVLTLKLVTGNLPPQAVLVAGSELFSATYMLIILLTGGIDEDERRGINRITFRYLRLKAFRLVV